MIARLGSAALSHLRGRVAHGIFGAALAFSACRAIESLSPWASVAAGLAVAVILLPVGAFWEYDVAPAIAEKWTWLHWSPKTDWAAAAAFVIGAFGGLLLWIVLWSF